MYRTNKNFMKDPATANQRIYIGNLAETLASTDLESRFMQHGIIIGLVLRKGFAFIQYEKDAEAQAAIRNEHGKMFFGKQLNVRQAIDKAKMNQPGNPTLLPPNSRPGNVQKPTGFSNQKPPQNPSFEPQKPLLATPNQNEGYNQPIKQEPKVIPPEPTGFHMQEPPESFEKPQEEQKFKPDFPMDRNQRFEKPGPMKIERPLSEGREEIRGPPRKFEGFQGSLKRESSFRGDRSVEEFPEENEFPERKADGFMERGRGRGRGVRGRNRGGPPPAKNLGNDKFSREPSAPHLYTREEPSSFSAPSFVPPVLGDAPERNDCEIIVVSKLLTEYAEYLEQRLKFMGLSVDLLFPMSYVPIGRVLANISSRGCLYAILVMPQNEEHRSLTLNILHRIPQEHRNIPIEDALIMISRNFDAYMRGDKLDNSINGNASITDRHPEAMQMLLNLLAENRQLTVGQYERIIKYLLDRKDLQSQAEIAEGPEPITSEPTNKETELQNRIMSILNKSNESPKQPETPQNTPLLQDPSVQKALDSLLAGDMFKGIN